MHRRLSLLVAASAALTAVLTSCSSGSDAAGSGSPRPGEVVWARPAAIDGWEGDKCISQSGPVNAVVYDSLLRIQTPGGDGLTPGLAAEWSYDAATSTYDFVLRDDAAFSNGDPVTSADVAFSVARWKSGAVSGVLYAGIDRVDVISATELHIVMAAPDTFLPDLLTWCNSTVYPANFAGMSAEDYFQHPIGAGPFAVDSWTDPGGPTEAIRLVPNDHFYGWGDSGPALQSLTIETVSDANQRAVQFQSGAVDILERVDSAIADQLDGGLVQTLPSVSTGIVANTTSGPASDPLVREAIAHAIDRDAIAVALGGGAVAATGILPVNVPGTTPPSDPYTMDVDQARELMARSGSPDGLSMRYSYDPSSADSQTVAQVLVTQLAAIGIDLVLDPTDSATLSGRLADHDFDLARSAAGAISPTIFDPIGLMLATSYLYSGADTSVMSDGFVRGTATEDPAVVTQIVRGIQDDALTQNAYIGVVDVAVNWAAQSWVKGFTPLQYMVFYTDQLSVSGS